MTRARPAREPRIRGMRQRVIPLILTIALTGCATPDGGSQSVNSRHLPTILEEVRAHPEKRQGGEAACERSISDWSGDFPVNLFFAGLFDVPAPAGEEAFCAAIIEAVIAGDLSKSELDAFKKPSALRGKEPLGNLLRKLIVAHERLSTQQALSCDCGQ